MLKKNHHIVLKASVMLDHQMILYQHIRATMRIGALLLPLLHLFLVLLLRVRVFPFHQTVAVKEKPDGSRRHIIGLLRKQIDLSPIANRLAMTTTKTMWTKTTTKTKTKTIVAICPIQVPVLSPPGQPVEPLFPT